METFTTTVVKAAVSITTFTVPSNESTSWYDNFHFENYFQQTPEEPIIKDSDVIAESNKQKYLYVSQKLFDLLRTKKECYSSKKNFLYHYLYFCSTIWYLKNVDKRNKEKEYVHINFKTMIEILSKSIYAEMIKNLKEWGIIEENPYWCYQVGNYSKSYKLKAPFDTNIERIPVEDKLINKKLYQHKMKKQKEIQKLSSPFQYLSYTNTQIKMDVVNAIWYNEVNYLTQQVEKYNANLYSVYAYEDEWYRFSVDTFGNRAHTNLTNLSSDFRQFLSVDGEPLGQVDISNSQPLFFYLHIKDLHIIPQSEKDKYRKIVEDGLFYEFFMDKLKIPAERRKKVKSKILTAVFFDKYRKKENRYIKVFKKDFPQMAAYIKKIRKRDYKHLARILQKTESKFVIEKVVAQFMIEFQENEFIATIHDSIVVKNSMLNTAREIMLNCFWSEDVNPKLNGILW